MTTFAAQRPRLFATLAGLAAFALSAVFCALEALAIDRRWSPVFVVVPFVLCTLPVWWRAVARRIGDSAPQRFWIRRYRRRPLYATANDLRSMNPSGPLLAGLYVVGVIFVRDPFYDRFATGALALVVTLWLRSLLRPSFLQLSPEGLVTRGPRARRMIPWDAIHAGPPHTHRDQDGGIWFLVDHSIPERRSDRMTGRPDGPPGYHWIRVSRWTLIDQGFLEAAIHHYRLDHRARALIGTPDGLQALL